MKCSSHEIHNSCENGPKSAFFSPYVPGCTYTSDLKMMGMCVSVAVIELILQPTGFRYRRKEDTSEKMPKSLEYNALESLLLRIHFNKILEF